MATLDVCVPEVVFCQLWMTGLPFTKSFTPVSEFTDSVFSLRTKNLPVNESDNEFFGLNLWTGGGKKGRR